MQIAIEDVDEATSVHCFDKLVLVPWTFSSVLFQCKNRKPLVPQCGHGRCNGTGLTDIYHFHDHEVLSKST